VGAKDNVRSAHWAFRDALVSELLKEPAPKVPKAPKQSYVTKNTVLPAIRLTRPIEIHQQIEGKQAHCVFYRWSRAVKKSGTEVITKAANTPKTNTVCSHCKINLCLQCFTEFHYCVD
jgi:hypothetical protein